MHFAMQQIWTPTTTASCIAYLNRISQMNFIVLSPCPMSMLNLVCSGELHKRRWNIHRELSPKAWNLDLWRKLIFSCREPSSKRTFHQSRLFLSVITAAAAGAIMANLRRLFPLPLWQMELIHPFSSSPSNSFVCPFHPPPTPLFPKIVWLFFQLL